VYAGKEKKELPLGGTDGDSNFMTTGSAQAEKGDLKK